MKISRRRKYNKRSKYTKRVKYTLHTKHGGGKHYKNKRTYRKHSRKLKHKSRLQRGGEITYVEKKFYTEKYNSELKDDIIYLFNIPYLGLKIETILSLYHVYFDYGGPFPATDSLLRDIYDIVTPEIRGPENDFYCEIELVDVRVTDMIYYSRNFHNTYKFELRFSTGKLRSLLSTTYLELTLVFDLKWKKQLATNTSESKAGVLPALPALPALPDLPALPALPDLPDLPALPDLPPALPALPPVLQDLSGGDGPRIVLGEEFLSSLGIHYIIGIEKGILTQEHVMEHQNKNKYLFFPFKAVRSTWDVTSGTEVHADINNRDAFQIIIDIMKRLIQTAEERINGIYM